MTAEEWDSACPERVEWERDRFRESGLTHSERRGRAGGGATNRLVFITSLPFRGRPIDIDVVFPFEYPDLPPDLYGPIGLLERHQSATGRFCVPASEHEWAPTRSAAEVVIGPLRALLHDSEQGPAAVAAGEADMPEPRSATLSYAPLHALLVPEPFWDAPLPGGCGGAVFWADARDERYLLQEFKHQAAADSALTDVLWSGERRAGLWVHIDEPAIGASPADLLGQAQAYPGVGKAIATHLRGKKRRPLPVAVTFIEEGPARGQRRRAWALLRIDPTRPHEPQLFKAQALTQDERAVRIPELRGLDAARFLLVGGGSLGGAVAAELAKAGAERVTIIDPDEYEANNAVRHVLPVRWTATGKARAVAAQTRQLNPFCHASAVGLRIGSAEAATELPGLLADHDVVIDTTGSAGVARILNRYCRTAGRTLIVVGLTTGAYGADLVVLRAGGPCWECFDDRRHDGSIPPAAAGPVSTLTPVGCAAPTFSGAGFEATELAANIARTAVRASLLTHYPPLDYDWAVLNFRQEPRWAQGRLTRTQDCQKCQ